MASGWRCRSEACGSLGGRTAAYQPRCIQVMTPTACGRDTALAPFAIFQQSAPPSLGPPSLRANPLPIKTLVSASATFSDTGGPLDAHAAMWDWGDGRTT